MDFSKQVSNTSKMDIKEEMDVKNVCLLNNTCEKFLNELEYNATNIKIEEDPAYLSETASQNVSSDDIKQEIDVEPTTLLDSNRFFFNESQYSNIKLEKTMTKFNKQILKCNICGIKFKFKSFLKQHMASHTKERPFKCETCLETFKEKRNLSWHRLVKHSEYKCDICNKKFKSKEKLKNHLAIPNKRDFQCDICHKKFTQKGNLRTHLQFTHSDKYGFSCYICDRKFKRKAELESHSVIHSDNYDYQCYICHKKFKRKSELNGHLVTQAHLNKFNFECIICHEKFKRKRDLNKHLPTHSIENNFDYNCIICHEKFKLKGDLIKHLVTHSDK